MLVQILTKKFVGDVQNGLEGWERLIREFESQSEYNLPDFVLCGIVLAGIDDHSMKEHLAMNSNRLDSFFQDEVGDRGHSPHEGRGQSTEPHGDRRDLQGQGQDQGWQGR